MLQKKEEQAMEERLPDVTEEEVRAVLDGMSNDYPDLTFEEAEALVLQIKLEEAEWERRFEPTEEELEYDRECEGLKRILNKEREKLDVLSLGELKHKFDKRKPRRVVYNSDSDVFVDSDGEWESNEWLEQAEDVRIFMDFSKVRVNPESGVISLGADNSQFVLRHVKQVYFGSKDSKEDVCFIGCGSERVFKFKIRY